MNNIIQALWIGTELSKIEQLCIASFLYHGCEFHLYTYGDVANVPDAGGGGRFVLMDANQIIPEKDIFTTHGGGYAIFSDWFRWSLLYEKGNFWVDMDVICLKPFVFNEDLVYGFQNTDSVCNAILKFPPQHELSQLLMSVCSAPNKLLPYDSAKRKIKKMGRKIIAKITRRDERTFRTGWGESGGPVGFTNALKHFNLLDKAKPTADFYPVDWQNWLSIFDGTLAKDDELLRHSYAIHLWNEAGRQHKFDKNASFPKNSLIERLKARYL